jgi:protein transport protein SEC23
MSTFYQVLKDRKKANVASLGFGCLVSPGKETIPSPPTLRRDGQRCRSCGGYVNLFCGIIPNSGHWRCSLCNKLNSSEGEYRSATSQNIQSWPELVTSVVDYVDGGGLRRPGFVSVSDAAMAAPIVILIDEALDDPHLQHLQSSLHSFLDSLSPATRIGIVTFGKTVSVYDLSEQGLAAADVLPGGSSPSQELLKILIYGTGVYLAPIHAALAVAHNIISSLRPYRGTLPEVARDRCLGTAVEVALSLIQGPSTELPRSTVKRSGGSNRIIACVGGPNTVGVGSLPYSNSHPNYAYLEKKAVKQMDHLGHEARRLDTAVDVLCAGTCPVRIPTLQPLTKASGAMLVLHDDFGETFGLNMQRSVRRASGFRGVLEVRCSSEVVVTRVIGPGKEARVDSSEFQNDTATAVQMLSIEDSQGFALSMEVVRDITGDFVYFQFVARYTNVYQMQLTRVITVRLPTTGSPSTYLQSVDDNVAAVLSAKKTVLLAEKASDLLDAKGSVNERVKDIAKNFGVQLTKTKLWQFPKELPALPELLYHLRRGPMLGSVVGHEDERAVYRSIFLQASFDLSLRMMAPRLLMHREGGTFEELPAYDLAMQSDTSLVMDHGTDLFIWMVSLPT